MKLTEISISSRFLVFTLGFLLTGLILFFIKDFDGVYLLVASYLIFLYVCLELLFQFIKREDKK